MFEQRPEPSDFPTDTTTRVDRAVVFMGGIGYHEQRNRDVGVAIVQLAEYSHTLSIPDTEPSQAKDGTIVHKYADGKEVEKPGKDSLKQLGKDDAEVRFSKLHADRAKLLIAAIEADGSQPVDAVFQSADVSTGILAMHERPELFKKVVFMDPSSIIDLPPRKQYLKEEWRNGNLRQFLKRKRDDAEAERFEEPTSLLDKIKRARHTGANGNQISAYVSSQAKMLHEIAKGEHAPDISIIASQFDHAYSPVRIVQSLVDTNDIGGFFVTNMRHGLGGKQIRLEQMVQVLQQTESSTGTLLERIHFFGGVTEEYRKQLTNTIRTRVQK